MKAPNANYPLHLEEAVLRKKIRDVITSHNEFSTSHDIRRLACDYTPACFARALAALPVQEAAHFLWAMPRNLRNLVLQELNSGFLLNIRKLAREIFRNTPAACSQHDSITRFLRPAPVWKIGEFPLLKTALLDSIPAGARQIYLKTPTGRIIGRVSVCDLTIINNKVLLDDSRIQSITDHVGPAATASATLTYMTCAFLHELPVLDTEARMIGLLLREDLARATLRGSAQKTPIRKITSRVRTHLGQVLKNFTANETYSYLSAGNSHRKRSC